MAAACEKLRRLSGRRFALNSLAAANNRAGLAQLVLVPLLPDEEPDPGRHLPDAVPDGEPERINLENDLLKVRKLICHDGQMILPDRSPVQHRRARSEVNLSGLRAC